MTIDVEFRGAQILDILLQKWFFVDPSFRVPNLKEEDELEENSPTKVRRRKNLLPNIGEQSQGAHANVVHPIGETSHPQLDGLDVKELDPRLVAVMLSIFHIGEAHINEMDTGNHSKSPK